MPLLCLTANVGGNGMGVYYASGREKWPCPTERMYIELKVYLHNTAKCGVRDTRMVTTELPLIIS